MRSLLIGLLCSMLATGAIAQEDAKLRAAAELHAALIGSESGRLVDAIMNAILAQTGGEFPPEVADAMRELVREIVVSEEYARVKARIYVDHLSLEDIQSLASMVRTPMYQRYAEVLPKMTDASNAALSRLMMENQPRIQQRLQEAWERAEGTPVQ